MDTSDWIALAQAATGAVGLAAVLGTLWLLRHDLKLQREEQEHQTETWQFELYQRIDDRIAELVWMQSGDARLSRVYRPLTAQERTTLNAAQAAADQWGAWSTLDDDEKVVYRFTRIFLETLEQMYEVRSRGWVRDDLWEKWAGWIETWCATRYFTYVYEDQYPRLLPGFRELLRETCGRLDVDCELRSLRLRPALPETRPDEPDAAP